MELHADDLSLYDIREALIEEGFEKITAERVRQLIKREKQP